MYCFIDFRSTINMIEQYFFGMTSASCMGYRLSIRVDYDEIKQYVTKNFKMTFWWCDFFLFLTKRINIIVCWLKSYQISCICRITVTLLLLVHADKLIRDYMMINFKTVENLSKLTYTWYLHNICTSILTTLSIWINFTNSLISLWYVMTRVTISVFSKKKKLTWTISAILRWQQRFRPGFFLQTEKCHQPKDSFWA